MKDDVSTVQAFDNSGANLNAAFDERSNWTPLIAAIYFQSTNTIQYLVAHNVDVTCRGNEGITALSMAIMFRDTNTVQLLIEKYPAELRTNEMWERIMSQVSMNDHSNLLRSMLSKLFETNHISGRGHDAVERSLHPSRR